MINNDYLNYVSDQLTEIGEFETKKMFGGIGFFKDGNMFAMIGNNVFRLKVDESNQADFEKHGMKPYHSDTKKKGMPYWEVPEGILNDKKELAKWASKSIQLSTTK
ncbi:MAG: TfoX/Sxy family protein [Saprospiraceae bacterium]